MAVPNANTKTVDGGWMIGLDGYEDMALHNGRLLVGASFEMWQLDPLTGEALTMEEAGDGPGFFDLREGNLVYADEDEEFDFGPAEADAVWPNGRSIRDSWAPDLPSSITGHGVTVTITADSVVMIESAEQAWQLDPVTAMVNWGAYISTGWLYIAIADERLAGINLSKPIGDTLIQLGLIQQ